jgi:hypothetical protein
VPFAQVGEPLLGCGHAEQLAPQWTGSVLVSAQVPAQSVRPPRQAMPHEPLSQVGKALLGAVQTRPSHPPQWEVSLAMFTQDPSQSTVPGPQLKTQCPPAQTSPLAQA